MVGIGLALASVTQMPLIAIEAKETLACGVLALTLLIGLVANATLGW